MRKLFYLIIICASNHLLAQEYTLSGTIKDGENGETLLGANLFLLNTNYGVTTNEYGFYSLTAPAGNYTLVVSYIGFKETQIPIILNANKKLNFELEISSTQLKEVEVIAKETENISLRSPKLSVSKLNTKTIKQIPAVLGEVDVLKSIQLLPGVTNSGEGTVGFNVRGGAVDQNLVLLDEAIIYNTSHLFGFFSVFNADAIKNLNLYKGNIPSQYGGRVSSVLDIYQKEGNNKRFQLDGGIGLISSRLTAQGPLKSEKSSFLVAGRSSYAHLFLKAADQDNLAGFYDINFKTNYQLNKNNKLFLSGYFGRDFLEINNAIENNYGNLSGNLRWNHIFNEKLFANLSLIYSKYDYQVVLDFIGLDWVSSINNYNIKYDLKYYATPNVKLNFGLSSIHYNFDTGEVKPTDENSEINYLKLDEKRAMESAVYVSADHTLVENLTLSYGLRTSFFNRMGGQTLTNYANNQPVVYNEELEIYEEGTPVSETPYKKGDRIKNFTNFEPRFGLSYQLNEATAIKAGYSRASQYLHLISNTTSVTPVDIWAPSGKYIKPQMSNQWAIGLFKEINNNTYSFEFEAYYKNVKNRIDYIDGSNLIGNNTIETEILNGKSRAYGIEILLKKNQGPLTGWIAYTLSKSEQQTPGGSAGGPGINNGQWYYTGYDRTHDISITTNYKLSDKWSFGTNFIFQTGRPVTYPNSQYQYEGLSIANYGLRNKNRLPSYHRVDISATYIPNRKPAKRWKGEWVFGIYNIYNRKNAASITFGQNRKNGANEATRTAIFGIVPSVTYNFKF
ncbi:TonB-dependent receptor [Zhouia amylolytica]|uniref:TonB-dependent receptor n=1 Tax=Zhouia amylolytica AD3 TaxID=1286632 RepID=W2UKT9_9FLAO|nr:TonB-dependent receptor [Zhouia amylolytica]ETN94066.1 tonB-dependent receptor [Zhouia amylolytica AD3]